MFTYRIPNLIKIFWNMAMHLSEEHTKRTLLYAMKKKKVNQNLSHLNLFL